MKPALLDTDIFSEVLKGRNVAMTAAAKNYRAAFSRLTISTITIMEIVSGLQQKRHAPAAKRFWELIDVALVLDFDRGAAELAGRIMADLTRAGYPLGTADPMIAGVSLRHNLVLVTANTAHFERIRELGYPLELENWRAG